MIRTLIILFGVILSSVQANSQSYNIQPLGLSDTPSRGISLTENFMYVTTESSGVLKRALSGMDTTWSTLGLVGRYLKSIFAYTVDETQEIVLTSRDPSTTIVDSIDLFAYTETSGWVAADSGLPDGIAVYSIHGYLDSSGNQRIFLGTSGGIYENVNDFRHWINTWNQSVGFVVRANGQHGFVWVGSDTDTDRLMLLWSTNRGVDWTWKTFDYPAFFIVSALAIVDSEPGTCLAAGWGVIFGTLDTGTSISPLLQRPGTLFYGLGIDHGNANHYWIGGWQDSTVFFESYDTGKTWMLHEGMKTLPIIREMATGVDNGVVFIATDGGVFRYESLVSTVGGDLPFPGAARLSSNYPNPFNSSTTIEYSLRSRAAVDLRIYNVLGQEVKTLFSDFQSPGNYETRWLPEGVGSGIYVCRIRIGKKDTFIKLVYLK